MGLLIYDTPEPSAYFSADGLFNNPLLNAFDGVLGGTVNRRLYVRNDDSAKSYTGITLAPVLIEGYNIINGSNGYGWKLMVGETQPLDEQWSLISFANTISIPNIGTALVSDTATYMPFWLRMIVPAESPVASYSNVKLRLNYTEIVVP